MPGYILDPSTGGGGVSDHGALTGLADDDHTQYALADGSRGAFATEAQGALADSALQAASHWIPFTFYGALEVGSGLLLVPMPAACTVTGYRVKGSTAPTGASVIFDINKNGTTIFTTQGNRPTVAISGTTSTTTLPDVTAFAAGDYMGVDVDQIGSTIAGSDFVLMVAVTET